jgi:hypothetical protein
MAVMMSAEKQQPHNVAVVGVGSPMILDTSKAAVENLFTKEDPYHMHKTLGFLSLLSFFLRLRYLGEQDLGFQSWPSSWTTVPTVLLHLALGYSSLIFKIPARRIREGNRIWPQFRLHSICFVTRHSLFILLYWIERHVWPHHGPFYWANVVIVFGTFLAVDMVNATTPYPSNSVRDLQAHPAAKYFFTVMQFNAIGNCLAGRPRRSTLHYWMIFVIQSSAFGTTLRRRNIFVGRSGQRIMVFLYGTMLSVGLSLSVMEVACHASLHELALTTAVSRSIHLLRVGGPDWWGHRVYRSKYVLWGIAAMVLHVTRSVGPNPPPFGVWLSQEPQSRFVRLVSLIMLTAQIVYGFVVSRRQQLLRPAKTTMSSTTSSTTTTSAVIDVKAKVE